MKKVTLILSLFWATLFWILLGYLIFNLIGCAPKEPWWKKHGYDPKQQIDLTLVPDIFP